MSSVGLFASKVDVADLEMDPPSLLGELPQ